MKKVIWSLVFGFCSLAAFAQGTGAAIVTKDTVYQSNSNGKFYETRLVEWSNGESSKTVKLIGDTLTVFNGYLNETYREANRMANVAFEARDFNKIIQGLLQRRDTVLAKLNKDIADTLAAKYAGQLLQSGWKVHEELSILDVTFSINAQGQLRYQIQGFVTRNAFLLGRTMRLQNFKDGDKLDFYQAPGGNWFTVDDRVKIKLPSNQGLNRAIDGAAPSSQKTVPKTAPKKKKN